LELDELWDGRDEKGIVVANGVYFYMVKTDNDEPAYGKILVLQ
jgi:flagellar hook assembly protein FlgD